MDPIARFCNLMQECHGFSSLADSLDVIDNLTVNEGNLLKSNIELNYRSAQEYLPLHEQIKSRKERQFFIIERKNVTTLLHARAQKEDMLQLSPGRTSSQGLSDKKTVRSHRTGYDHCSHNSEAGAITSGILFFTSFSI